MEKTIERRTMLEEIKGTPEYIEKYFPIVRASTLSLDDEFLKHEPKRSQQTNLKMDIILAIASGLPDFRAQIMDSSLDNEEICFKAGMKPAVGKTTEWWKKKVEAFMPEKHSRIGTIKQRSAFLGLIIKYLIEERGYTVRDAWEAVCNQSRNLGHYWDSENPKHDFEETGSRQVGEWYDLGNVCKIVLGDNTGRFFCMGGFYGCDGKDATLPYLTDLSFSFGEDVWLSLSVAWMVMDV